MRRGVWVTVLLGLAAASRGAAQPTPPLQKSLAACCALTVIEARTGIVTAQEASTGHRFRFEVADRVVLRGLRVGQKVWADFAAGKAGFAPAAPCCTILGARGDARGQPEPEAACCAISAIDLASHLVTAKLNSSQVTFGFRVTDQSVLASLKLGQPVWASRENRKVSLKPGEACCDIVTPIPVELP